MFIFINNYNIITLIHSCQAYKRDTKDKRPGRRGGDIPIKLPHYRLILKFINIIILPKDLSNSQN